MYSLIDGSYFINLWKSIWKSDTLVPQNDSSQNDIWTPVILTPAMIYLKETEILERNDIFRILSSHKHFRSLRFSVPAFYSTYLLSHLILDVLDVLSNELFFVQTKIEFWFENQKDEFIQEFQYYLKKNVPFLQKNKILPLYIYFQSFNPYHIEHSVVFDQRFHILFLKETSECFTIQRIYFSIDI
jgi:hypothetical protein